MSKNVLNIRVTSTSGFIISSLQKPIPQQRITLKNFKIHFDSAAEALACDMIIFTCPWISSSSCPNMIDTLSEAAFPFYRNGGIIFNVDNQVVTLAVNNEITYDMSSDIAITYPYNLYGLNLAGFLSLSFQLEFDQISAY